MVFHNGTLKTYILDLDDETIPEDVQIDAHFYMA